MRIPMRSGEEIVVNNVDGEPKWTCINTGLIKCEKRDVGEPVLLNGNSFTNMKSILNGKAKFSPSDHGLMGNNVIEDCTIGLNSSQAMKHKSQFSNGSLPELSSSDDCGPKVDALLEDRRGKSESKVKNSLFMSNISSCNSPSLNSSSQIDNYKIKINIHNGSSSCNDISSSDYNIKESRKNNISRASPKRRKISSCSISANLKKRIPSKKKGKSEPVDFHNQNFQHSVFSSCDEDESICSDYTCLPTFTLSHKLIARNSKLSDLRNQLISHKFLLTKLIKVKQSGLKNLVHTTKDHIKKEGLLDEPGRTHLDTILESKSTRISSKLPDNFLSIRRGTCCFEKENFRCNKPSLPFGRHCRQHILYNVNQLLFVRCTAKDNVTLTQCTSPSLDILRGDPLCDHHWHLKNRKSLDGEIDFEEQQHLMAGKGKGKNGSRSGRRSKRRRRIGGKSGSGSIDSIDSSSFLSQDSSDGGAFINSDNCDSTQVHLSTAIKIHPSDIASTSSSIRNGDHVISSSHSPLIHSELPSDRNLSNNLPIVTKKSPSFIQAKQPSRSSSPPNIDVSTAVTNLSQTNAPPVVSNPRNTIPTPLDVGVSSIVPGDEALVASLVAELPPLGQETVPEAGPVGFVDADLTDVLNKIPDDAFNDSFVEHLKNGDIPSREESEALEEALLTVSKNVHYLSVAAAVVGRDNNIAPHPTPTTSSTTTVGSPNGDTSFYSHQLNGQVSDFHIRQNLNSAPSLNLNESDILGLANNILTSLTTEQQQQLNGLIDGALASGTLASSPTLKSALASFSNLTSEGDQLGAQL